MSGQLLDAFAIAFNSENIKEFQETVKQNEKELDNAEKKVKELEDSLNELNKAQEKRNKELKELEKSEKKDEIAIKKITNAIAKGKIEIEKTTTALNNARQSSHDFTISLSKLKGDARYNLAELAKTAGNLVKQLGLIITVSAVVRKSLDFYEQAEQLDLLSQKTDIATDKLQQLGKAAQSYGGNTEMTAQSVVNLRAVYGSEASPDEMLEKVAQKMETLKTDAEKWNLADSLGIDEATTQLLIAGVGKYREELQKADKYRMFTPEEIQRMRDYRHIQQDIKYGLENIQAIFARFLLPVIMKVSEVIKNVVGWLNVHEGAVKLVGIFLGLATAIGGIALAIKGVSAAVTILEAHPIVRLIIIIIGLLTLLFAIYEDFFGFLTGKSSVIERILKKMGYNVDEVRQNCLHFFGSLVNWITSSIKWISSLGGGFTDLANKIKSLWDSIPAPFKKLIGLSNPITGTYTILTTAKEQINKINKNPNNAVPSGAISNYNQSKSINENNNNNVRNINSSNKKSVNINKVEIVTKSNDAKGIAREVTTLNYLDNGLRT